MTAPTLVPVRAPEPAMSRRRLTRNAIRRSQASPVAYTFLIVVLLASVFPLWWSFVIGSKDATAINSGGVSLLPGGNFLANARTVVDTLPFWKALANSLIVSTAVGVAVVLLSTMAGFAFAKLRFRGKGVLLVFVIAT
ncbi:MAG: carbohydrate ABC transporter permease, partial [Terracoccus sp.]